MDTDWRAYYEGRMDHPETEAEKVVFDKTQKLKTKYIICEAGIEWIMTAGHHVNLNI